MTHAIGIDLGTSELRAAAFTVTTADGPHAALLRRGKGTLRIPAAVALGEDGSLIVGERARRLQISRPQTTVRCPLTLLGARFEAIDPAAWAPLQLLRDHRGDVRLRLGDRVLSPTELVAAQLLDLRELLEELLGEPPPPLVLTIPAGLGDRARRALVDASAIAGIDLLRLLPATTAAAVELQAVGGWADEPTLALLDLGAGSFTAAIVELAEGRVTAVSSASALRAGSRVIDARLAELLGDAALQSWDQPELASGLTADPVALVRLRDAAEKAKIDLSSARERVVHLPFLAADPAGVKHLEHRLTQATLEKRIRAAGTARSGDLGGGLGGDLLGRWENTLGRALAACGRSLEDLSEVILLGRGAHLPLLQDRLEAMLGRTPNLRWLDADLAARGAARVAATMLGVSAAPPCEVEEILGRPIVMVRDPRRVAALAENAAVAENAENAAVAEVAENAAVAVTEDAEVVAAAGVAAVAEADEFSAAEELTASSEAAPEVAPETPTAPAEAPATERIIAATATVEVDSSDPSDPTPRPAPEPSTPQLDDLPPPEVLFPATIAIPASHTELFEVAPGDLSGVTAHFHLREGEGEGGHLGEHILRGRPAIDLTFHVDLSGILRLAFRESFRGREAILEVIGGGGMSRDEVATLAATQRALDEARRRQRRTESLKEHLDGHRERGRRILQELAEGIPAGDAERLREIFAAIDDALVAGSLSALEAAEVSLTTLLAELPAAIAQAIRGPAPEAAATPQFPLTASPTGDLAVSPIPEDESELDPEDDLG